MEKDMHSSETHRRYFDLKVMLVLIFLLLAIFTVTRSRAQAKLPPQEDLTARIHGLGAVPPGDIFYVPGQIMVRGIQGTMLYHPDQSFLGEIRFRLHVKYYTSCGEVSGMTCTSQSSPAYTSK
jgi:hypothetical protein